MDNQDVVANILQEGERRRCNFLDHGPLLQLWQEELMFALQRHNNSAWHAVSFETWCKTRTSRQHMRATAQVWASSTDLRTKPKIETDCFWCAQRSTPHSLLSGTLWQWQSSSAFLSSVITSFKLPSSDPKWVGVRCEAQNRGLLANKTPLQSAWEVSMLLQQASSSARVTLL